MNILYKKWYNLKNKTLFCSVSDGALDLHHPYVPLIPRAEDTRPPPFPLCIIRVLYTTQ